MLPRRRYFVALATSLVFASGVGCASSEFRSGEQARKDDKSADKNKGGGETEDGPTKGGKDGDDSGTPAKDGKNRDGTAPLDGKPGAKTPGDKDEAGGKADGKDAGGEGKAEAEGGILGVEGKQLDRESDGVGGEMGGVKATSDPGAADGSEPGLTTDEGKVVAMLPGTKVVRVGVNFEDQGLRGDRDHNDAVLCFTGRFKVENSNVVSIKNQQVAATTSSISGCTHDVRVAIMHADGSKEPEQKFSSRNATPVMMNLKVGSKMEVYMTATDDDCDEGVEKNMHSDVDCKVLADVCNTTGN